MHLYLISQCYNHVQHGKDRQHWPHAIKSKCSSPSLKEGLFEAEADLD